MGKLSKALGAVAAVISASAAQNQTAVGSEVLNELRAPKGPPVFGPEDPGGSRPEEPLMAFARSREVQALPLDERIMVLGVASHLRAKFENQPGIEKLYARLAIGTLKDLIASESFLALDTKDRNKVLEIFKVSYQGSDSFVEFLSLHHPESYELLIHEQGTGGAPVLDALYQIATRPLHREISAAGVTAAELIDDLTNLLGKRYIFQANRGACAAGAVITKLLLEQPGEIARLVAGLVDSDGRERFADGSEVQLNTSGITGSDTGDNRTRVLRILQASFLDFAVPEFRYSNDADSFYRGTVVARGAGLFDTEVRRLMEAVFNTEFEVFEGRGQEVLARLRQLSRGYTYMSLEWDARSTRHAVLHSRFISEAEKGDRLAFYNSHGSGLMKPGRILLGPRRRIESLRPTEESIAAELIPEQLASIVYEKSRFKP